MSEPNLDAVLRQRASTALEPGDVIIGWVAVAGVRTPGGGGYTITAVSPDYPPDWMSRGMLAEALTALDVRITTDLPHED